jgi:hypothetical protein
LFPSAFPSDSCRCNVLYLLYFSMSDGVVWLQYRRWMQCAIS